MRGLAAGCFLAALLLVPARAGAAGSFTNPLAATFGGGQVVENCADPTVLRSQTPGDDAWYMYCTSDPLADGDAFHLLPGFRSTDLVHWTHVGDAFTARPGWIEPGAGLWAPDLEFVGGRYHLYYAATNVRAGVSGEPNCSSDSAIGVAIASSPAGPWTDLGKAVVAPRRAGTGCSFHATIDPEVIRAADGTRYIYYGSFGGGLEVRVLSEDGTSAPPATAVDIAIPDRFEAPLVLQREGWYYLFVSAAGCCNGRLSGYSVFAGRSASPLGPFVDREGLSFLDGRAGGTAVLAMNGNRWVGPGHQTVATDAAGQDWLIYHAIDHDEPYFAGSPGYTKRPPMIDPLDWFDGWPTVSFGPSARPRVAPAVIAGEPARHRPCAQADDAPGEPLPGHSDEFEGTGLDPRWSWIRQPAAGSWAVADGVFRFDTQAADLYGSQNSASVLVQDAPDGDVLVEARLELDVPDSGCCYNYVQAGISFYGDDDTYVRLDHASIGWSRQTEFGKEEGPVPSGYSFFGGNMAGPPARWTWLRIVRRQREGHATYTAYSSRDGVGWTRGGTWTHDLGPAEKIGLLSLGGSGFHARFDYLRLFALAPFADPDLAATGAGDADLDGLADPCTPDDDGDGLADQADCAPFDPAGGTPPEVGPLQVRGSDVTVVSWSAAPFAGAYDVLRPALPLAPGGALGPCAADDLPATSFEDGARPPDGGGVGFLVRGVNGACGAGSYGRDSSGNERASGPEGCP